MRSTTEQSGTGTLNAIPVNLLEGGSIHLAQIRAKLTGSLTDPLLINWPINKKADLLQNGLTHYKFKTLAGPLADPLQMD